MWTDIIIACAIVLIIGGAVAYIVKSKKSGKGCIGCPNSDSCQGNCGSVNREDEKK
jgi:hypothetical protein